MGLFRVRGRLTGRPDVAKTPSFSLTRARRWWSCRNRSPSALPWRPDGRSAW